jgi:hypothetical protein
VGLAEVSPETPSSAASVGVAGLVRLARRDGQATVGLAASQKAILASRACDAGPGREEGPADGRGLTPSSYQSGQPKNRLFLRFRAG